MKEFFIENRHTILSLGWGIIAFLRWIFQYFQSQKKEVQIEKLRSKLEIEKNQFLMNDQKFRKWYEDFINLMMSIISKDKKLDRTDQWIISFMKVAILFAWPETIKTFGAYRKNAGKSDGEQEILFYMEKLLWSMRKDLGVSNEWLEQYDILQTFIVWDIKESLNTKPSN